MTVFQTDFNKDRRSKPLAFGLAAMLCLALLALLTVVQVAHIHALDRTADQCPLCIVMHSAAPVAAVSAAVVLVRTRAVSPAFEERAVVRQWHPKLFTRPPPFSH